MHINEVLVSKMMTTSTMNTSYAYEWLINDKNPKLWHKVCIFYHSNSTTTIKAWLSTIKQQRCMRHLKQDFNQGYTLK